MLFLSDSVARDRSIDQLLGERCDGNRNIVHTSVAMCSPQSNKDLEGGSILAYFPFWYLFKCLLLPALSCFGAMDRLFES